MDYAALDVREKVDLVALPTYNVMGGRLAAWTRATWAKTSPAKRPGREADPLP